MLYRPKAWLELKTPSGAHLPTQKDTGGPKGEGKEASNEVEDW